jgi:predicted nucleic acid-binding Zn ribbon protein
MVKIFPIVASVAVMVLFFVAFILIGVGVVPQPIDPNICIPDEKCKKNMQTNGVAITLSIIMLIAALIINIYVIYNLTFIPS